MEFFISPQGLEKWMHQNRAEFTGSFVERTLLDNFVIACKRGFAAVYEHPLNEWTSNYRVDFGLGTAQEVWSRWYRFEDTAKNKEENEMNKIEMTEYIKVNFPLTAEDFAAGNGEGMWVLVDKATKTAHDADETGGFYTGILDNDSIYYPGLNAGAVVQFEMRGENRPVAIFDGFLENLKRLTPAEKEEFIRKLVEGHTGRERVTDPADPRYEGPLCCDCQFCGDKHSFPEPNDLIEMDPENPMLKHFYCCCGDSELYGEDITSLEIHECECFEEL